MTSFSRGLVRAVITATGWIAVDHIWWVALPPWRADLGGLRNASIALTIVAWHMALRRSAPAHATDRLYYRLARLGPIGVVYFILWPSLGINTDIAASSVILDGVRFGTWISTMWTLSALLTDKAYRVGTFSSAPFKFLVLAQCSYLPSLVTAANSTMSSHAWSRTALLAAGFFIIGQLLGKSELARWRVAQLFTCFTGCLSALIVWLSFGREVPLRLGAIENPNLPGLILCILMPVLAHVSFARGSTGWAYAGRCSILLALAAALAFHSRSGWLAMSLSLILLYWFSRRRVLLVFLAAFVCGMFLMPAKYPYPRHEGVTIQGIVAERDVAALDVLMSGRITHYRRVISLIMERPLVGWGYAGSTSVGGAQPSRVNSQAASDGARIYGAHNFILERLVSTGIIGLTGFLSMIVCFGRNLLRSSQVGRDRQLTWPVLCFTLLATYLAFGFFDGLGPFVTNPLVFLLLGMGLPATSPELERYRVN